MKKVGITVVAAVCVVLLCVGFYFMKNSDGSQASKENLTVVQRINEKNLTDDYPKTPRAVIKLYNQIDLFKQAGRYGDISDSTLYFRGQESAGNFHRMHRRKTSFRHTCQ